MGGATAGGGGDGTQRRGHLCGRHAIVVVAYVGPGHGGLVTQIKRRGVVAARRGAAVLVDGALHLLQDLIDLLQVTLSAQVWHWGQVVVLVHGALGSGVASNRWQCRGGRHVLRADTAGVDGEGAVQGHQRPADLVVVAGLDSVALGGAKELVQVFVAAPAVVARGGAVAERLCAVVVNGLLVVPHGAVGLGGGMGVVAVVRRRRLAKGGGVGSHLAVVVIKARRAFAGAAVGSAQGAMLVLRGPDEDTVIGVGLDVLFQILRPLEGLAAEVALVRLQGDVDPDVRGDVVTLHSRGAARVPLARQVEVVGALPAYVLLAEMVLFGLGQFLLTFCMVDSAHSHRGSRGC